MLTATRTSDTPRVVFELKGDLRLEDIARLRESFFNAMMGTGIEQLVLDLKQLRSIDASGISLFVATKNSIGKVKGELQLVRPQPPVYEMFAKSHLVDYFGIKT